VFFSFYLICGGYCTQILRFANVTVKVLLKCISPRVKFISLQLTVKILRNHIFYTPATAITENILGLLRLHVTLLIKLLLDMHYFAHAILVDNGSLVSWSSEGQLLRTGRGGQ